MQPSAEPTAHSRGVVDRLVIGLLIGAVAVSVGAVALLTVYMNRIGDAAAGLRAVDRAGDETERHEDADDGRFENVVHDLTFPTLGGDATGLPAGRLSAPAPCR